MVKNKRAAGEKSPTALFSRLIQFSAVLLAAYSNLDRDAVIGSRHRRIRQNFLLAVAIQFLRPDDRGEILVTDVQINIAADACDLALFRMLPDGVAALDVIGGMRHE